ncbi:hypothetical protein ANN_13940 [Periplaneta americana]|uniref:Uncharacterized protein n=1 Tax=Periplaneta americana TaxID=6978 RepID=A0ABQ8SW95_PERAM|nr:hypothetical protein ANN_13940 [Periplaneta americana]
MKAQVSIILGYAIERQLAKRHGSWKSNTVAEDSAQNQGTVIRKCFLQSHGIKKPVFHYVANNIGSPPDNRGKHDRKQSLPDDPDTILPRGQLHTPFEDRHAREDGSVLYRQSNEVPIALVDKEGTDNTTVEDLFQALKVTIEQKRLNFQWLVSIATDGAPASYGAEYDYEGENPQTIRENAEILLETSKEIGLEVNPEKTKYMIMSRDQNIVRNGTVKVGDLSFEEVEKFKYLGATAIRRQMDIPSYHVGPPHRKETSGQNSAQMGRLLQRTGRSTMVQRGKRQKKVETTRETFVHRQEVVKLSERITVKEIQVVRLKYHV